MMAQRNQNKKFVGLNNGSIQNIKFSNIPTKFNKYYIANTKNNWQQVRRAHLRVKYYTSRYPSWLINSVKVFNAEPKLISYKFIDEPLPPKIISTKTWAPVEGVFDSSITFKNIELIKQKQEERRLKHKLENKIRDNFLWDMRYTFPYINTRKSKVNYKSVSDMRSRALGYIDDMPIFGPLTRGTEYYRLGQRRLISQAKIWDNLIYNSDLTFKQIDNILNHVDYLEKKKVKPIPNVNVRATSIKQIKTRVDKVSFNDSVLGTYNVDFELIRNPSLLSKLRYKIRCLRLYRIRNIINKIRRVKNTMAKQPMTTKVEYSALPQMDKDGEGSILPRENEDTTIIEQRIASDEPGVVFTERSWTKLTTTENTRSDLGLCERDIPFTSFVWSTTNPIGFELHTSDLPLDIIKDCATSPIALLFRQHRYWRGDIELWLQINSNQLMTGQLQMSFYYGASKDPMFKHKSNIYSSSQMLHSLGQAGSSNPARIVIKYAHMYPFMSTQNRINDDGYLDLGTLRVNVLNRLQSVSTADSQVYCTIFARIINNEFVGQVSSKYGLKPEMEFASALAISAAERYLVSSFKDSNRDMPPVPLQPSPVTIVPPGNMSYGTGIVEPIYSMRLDPAGQTTHIGLNRSEMRVTDFTSVYGLVTQLEWKMGQISGTLLGTWPASPIWEKREYHHTGIDIESFSVIPPVAYISSCYKLWRGTIEYRFDFICNSMYSGSVLIAYIPGVTGETIAMEDAKASSYVVFNLQEVRSFTFKTPYITDRPWWPRPFAGGEKRYDYQFPGSVCMYVLNPLSLNAIIPSNIDINVYMRGGSDFEVAIPVQPSISSSYYPYYKPAPQPTTGAKALPGYFPYYTGTSRYFRDNAKCLLRYGSLNDHISYFDNLLLDGYYKFTGTDAPFYRKYDKATGNWIAAKQVLFAVAIPDPGNSHYWLAVVADEEAARGFASSVAIDKADDKYLMDYVNDDKDIYFDSTNAGWSFIKWPSDNVGKYNSAQGQRDESSNNVFDKGSLPSTSYGQLHFGEDFGSLTNVLRRYQFLGSATLPANRIINFPCKPNGPFTFDSSTTPQMLKAREGLLSLISMCYRFYRGGVRYKFVCDTSTSFTSLVFIQHKSDITNFSDNDNSPFDAVISQGYGGHIIDVKANPIIPIEIPFYLDSVYGFLGNPEGNALTDKFRTCHLGRIYITTFSSNLRIQVYTALADDCRFELFQGVPPVKFIEREGVSLEEPPVETPPVEPPSEQLGLNKGDIIYCRHETVFPAGVSCSRKKQFKNNIAAEVEVVRDSNPVSVLIDGQSYDVISYVADPQIDEVDSQGSLITSLKRTNDTAEKVGKLTDKLNNLLDSSDSLWDKLIGKNEILKDFFSLDKLVNIMSQFGHMLISPCWQTVALGIATIIVNVLGLTFNWIKTLFETLSSFVRGLWEDEQTSPTVTPQGDSCVGSNVDIIGCLISLVSVVVGFSFSVKGKFLDNMRRLFMDFSIFGRGLDGIIKLLTYLLNATVRLFKYALLYKKNIPDVHVLLKDHGKEMVNWALKVETALDPEKLEEHQMEESFPDLIFDYFVSGTVYCAQLTSCSGNNQANMYVKALTDRLREMRDRLYKMGKHPYTRCTPWSLWFAGPPGYGKSTCVTSVATALLQAVGWNERRQPIYKIEPANDHWDCCTNQPILVMDDAFTVKTPNAMEQQISAYFNIVTNAPFTPPMAHLDNKFMRINPLALITCSNQEYPSDASLLTPEALYRRRHCMISVKLRDEYKDLLVNGNLMLYNNPKKSLTEKEIKEFVWLEFREYNNPRDPKDNTMGCPMTYPMLIKHLQIKFKVFYDNEMKAMQNRIREMMEICHKETTPESTPEEIKESIWQNVKTHIKRKWENIEKFVIDNEKCALANAKGSRFRDRILPLFPSRSVPPQTDIPDIPPLDYDDIIKFIKDYVISQRNSTISANSNNIDENVQIPNLDKFKEFFAKELDVNVENISYSINSSNVCKMRIDDNVANNLIKIYRGISLTEVETASVNAFISDWCKYNVGQINKNCKHKVCECYTIYTVNDHDFAIPTCADCLLGNRQPIRMKPCCCGCLLYNYVWYPSKWVGSQIYKTVRYLGHIILKTSRILLDSTVKYSKIAFKKTCTGVKYVIYKSLRFSIKYILPLLGLYFLGNLALNRRDKIVDKVSTGLATVTGKAIGYTGRYLELVDKYNRKYLVPEGSAYEASNNTRGSGKLPVRNLTVKTLAGQLGPDILNNSNDNNYINDVMRTINNNVYTLAVEYMLDEKIFTSKTRGLFIRGRQFLIVTHCWDELKQRIYTRQGKLYLVKYPSFHLEIDPSKIIVDKFSASNFSLITFPIPVNEHKKIVKFIPTKKQHQQITNRGTLIQIDRDIFARPVKLEFVQDMLTVRATANSDAVTMVGCYSYDFGGAGVCGSYVICNDTNPCLIGMHVAGQDKILGFCEPLIREMFEDIPDYGDDIVDVVLPPLADIDNSIHEIDGKFLQLGVVEAQYAHHESGVSNVVPSLVHGLFPIMTEPAPLTPMDPRLPLDSSPMREGVAKHGMPIKGFPQHLLNFALVSLTNELRVKVQPVIGVEPLDINTAICGRAGIRGFSSLNFNTSEGFPLAAHRPSGVANKKWLFDLELSADGYVCRGIDNKLANILSIKQKLREKNILPFTVFTDCLKDSRIAKEKCSIPGKTRVFSISPVDYSIQFRQYFLPYTVAHQNSRAEFSTAVGINVNGYEWSSIVLKMGNHSPHQMCGDYSNFGAGFDGQVHEIVGKAILDWFQYNGDRDIVNNRVRKVLLRELVNSYHLCFDIIYQVCCGMPSGSPITVETNDLVNLCYVLMAWHEIMRDDGLGSHYHFNKYVKIKTYGDDLWLSVSPNVITKFNNVAIAAFFDKYGVKYTDADKTGEIVPFKTIKEVSFLKRTPVPHPFRPYTYLAELDLKPALDIANWCWKSKDLKAATLVNLEACSDALFGFGPAIHDYYRSILQERANRLGFIGHFRSWQELDYIFFGESNGLITRAHQRSLDVSLMQEHDKSLCIEGSSSTSAL